MADRGVESEELRACERWFGVDVGVYEEVTSARASLTCPVCRLLPPGVGVACSSTQAAFGWIK